MDHLSPIYHSNSPKTADQPEAQAAKQIISLHN